MCGRYELSSHPAVIALAFGLPFPPDIRPRYNIAPMQQVPIIRQTADGKRELAQVRWGLVPRWAKNPSIGVRMINARAETVATKGAFRNAFARHRCLIPVNGFYEWRRTPSANAPMHIGMADGRPFGVAGLYERWLSPDGEVLDTCTILTTAACVSLRDVHERMPVIVPGVDHARWLDCANSDARDLLATWSGETLRAYQVSTRVNAVRNDDPGLLEPVANDEANVPNHATTKVPASNRRRVGDAAAAEPGEAAADAAVPDQLSLL
jgi:putative SOS response-associated peptidase YedK